MKLNLSWLLIATFVFNLSVFAQEEKKEEVKGYQFTEKINVPHASVKNQYRSGTCWSFSGIAFLEAELMRTQNKEYDLSEMFCVYHTYSDKAKKYIRLGGHLNFGSGAEFTDVFTVIEK